MELYVYMYRQSYLVYGSSVCYRPPYTHYVNTPMQHTAIFHGCKNEKFRLKCFELFHIFAQNIDLGTR